MSVPYTFQNTPLGSKIPLSELDANFTYVENQVSSLIANLPLQIVTNVSALRSISPSTSFNVQTEGYYTNGDGGGGVFYGVTGGSYTDNGGTIITTGLGVTASSAWIRFHGNDVSVSWFGAKFTEGTDDTPFVQRAIDYCLSTSIPSMLSIDGLCVIYNSLVINRATDAATSSDPFIIRGDGNGGGFISYNAVPMFTTTLPPLSSTSYSASQNVNFDNILFTTKYVGNHIKVLDDAKFLRMKFTNCAFIGVTCLVATYFTQSYYFDTCKMYGYLDIFFDSTAGAFDVKFNMCQAEAGAGFLRLINYDIVAPNPTAGCGVTNSLIESQNTNFAIQADRTWGFNVINCYFEYNTGGDINFATTRNLANLTPNLSASVIGCNFSPTPAQRTDPTYYSIFWGRVNNGFATANTYHPEQTQTSKIIPESRVVFLGEKSFVQGFFSELIYCPNGYVMPNGGESLKIFRGTIGSTGNILNGTGFTVTKLGTGQYQINMTNAPFGSNPSITVSALDSNAQNVSAVVNAITTSSFEIIIRNTSSAYIDSAFCFNVMGTA